MDSQQLRVLAAFTDIWNLDPKTHEGQLTTDRTPAPEDPGTFSGSSSTYTPFVHTHIQTHRHTHNPYLYILKKCSRRVNKTDKWQRWVQAWMCVTQSVILCLLPPSPLLHMNGIHSWISKDQLLLLGPALE